MYCKNKITCNSPIYVVSYQHKQEGGFQGIDTWPLVINNEESLLRLYMGLLTLFFFPLLS